MAKAAPTETPKFMFERRSDVEAAHDWLLAGILTIDAPKAPMPRAKRYQRTVNDIVAALIAAAETDTMPTDGLTIGWQGDEPDIEDDALAAWRERSLTFMLRAYVREDGHMLAEVRLAEAENEPGPKRPTLH